MKALDFKHPRMWHRKWWLYREKPGVGWQFWNRYDGQWEACLLDFIVVPGCAPGDQVISYDDTWAEPEEETP